MMQIDRKEYDRVVADAIDAAVKAYRIAARGVDGLSEDPRESATLVFFEHMEKGLSELNIGDGYLELLFNAKDRHRGELEKRLREVEMDMRKEDKVNQIRDAVVGSLIEPELVRFGRPYRFEYQKYRLKISVLIDWKDSFSFYVRYRDFQNPDVLGRIPEVLGMIPLLKDFGPQITVRAGDGGGNWHFPAKI